MDKERRELNERMRIIAKRVDHLERAFRKAEIPLLVDDYGRQQAEDKAAFEASRQGAIDAAKQAHQDRLDAKRRLLRIVPDSQAYRIELTAARQRDYGLRLQQAEAQIHKEKQKRREAVLVEREREAREEAERARIRREKEEEEARKEQGMSTLIISIWLLFLL